MKRTPQYGGGSAATARTAATAGVLLLVGVAAVAVLEVDPEVLDRLALELLQQQRPDRGHLVGVRADRPGQRAGSGAPTEGARLPRSLTTPWAGSAGT